MKENTLSNVTIADVMIEDVKYLEETTTIGEAVEAFSKYRVGGFPVVDSKKRVVALLQTLVGYGCRRAGESR